MKDKITYALMAITIVLITFFGVKYPQNMLNTAPLYVSIIVMLLQMNVNRYAFLLGGINSLLYAAVYFYYGLYGSVFYSITVSFVLQIATFINWGRNSYKKTSTVFKTMGGKKFSIFSVIFVICWITCYYVFKTIGSSHTLLDNSIMLLGIVTTLMTMLAYVEWTYLQLLSGIISVILYVGMIRKNPEMAAYLVYTIYSLICTCTTLLNVRRVYVEQQNQKSELSSEC